MVAFNYTFPLVVRPGDQLLVVKVLLTYHDHVHTIQGKIIVYFWNIINAYFFLSHE